MARHEENPITLYSDAEGQVVILPFSLNFRTDFEIRYFNITGKVARTDAEVYTARPDSQDREFCKKVEGAEFSVHGRRGRPKFGFKMVSFVTEKEARRNYPGHFDESLAKHAFEVIEENGEKFFALPARDYKSNWTYDFSDLRIIIEPAEQTK